MYLWSCFSLNYFWEITASMTFWYQKLYWLGLVAVQSSIINLMLTGGICFTLNFTNRITQIPKSSCLSWVFPGKKKKKFIRITIHFLLKLITIHFLYFQIVYTLPQTRELFYAFWKESENNRKKKEEKE